MKAPFAVVALVVAAGCDCSPHVIAAGEVSIRIDPAEVTLGFGEQQKFVATVSGARDLAVKFSVNDDCGAITAEGIYTAPSVAAQCEVVATALADLGKSAKAVVTVKPPPVEISISPTAATALMGETLQFVAQVKNATNSSVTWSVREAEGGSIAGGRYTAPMIAGTFHVAVTSVEDPTRSAVATVEVSAHLEQPVLQISPASVRLRPGQSRQFAANLPVQWSASGPQIDQQGLFVAGTFSSPSAVMISAHSADGQWAYAHVDLEVPITISPTSATIVVGDGQPFVTNIPARWSASGPAIASLLSIGTSSATEETFSASAPGSYEVIVTSLTDSTNTARAHVTVIARPPPPPPQLLVIVMPGHATLLTGATQQFTANQAVSWSATGGTISSAGLYTAPSIAGSYMVRATSTTDATNFGEASVTVNAPCVKSVTLERKLMEINNNGGSDMIYYNAGTGNQNIRSSGIWNGYFIATGQCGGGIIGHHCGGYHTGHSGGMWMVRLSDGAFFERNLCEDVNGPWNPGYHGSAVTRLAVDGTRGFIAEVMSRDGSSDGVVYYQADPAGGAQIGGLAPFRNSELDGLSIVNGYAVGMHGFNSVVMRLPGWFTTWEGPQIWGAPSVSLGNTTLRLGVSTISPQLVSINAQGLPTTVSNLPANYWTYLSDANSSRYAALSAYNFDLYDANTGALRASMSPPGNQLPLAVSGTLTARPKPYVNGSLEVYDGANLIGSATLPALAPYDCPAYLGGPSQPSHPPAQQMEFLPNDKLLVVDAVSAYVYKVERCAP
jgi:hypothetical protein